MIDHSTIFGLLQTIFFIKLIFLKQFSLLHFLLRENKTLCPYNYGLTWFWFGSQNNFYIVYFFAYKMSCNFHKCCRFEQFENVKCNNQTKNLLKKNNLKKWK